MDLFSLAGATCSGGHRSSQSSGLGEIWVGLGGVGVKSRPLAATTTACKFFFTANIMTNPFRFINTLFDFS